MNRVKTYLEENFPELWENGDILLADGFEDAFIGVVESHGAAPKACYNYDACIDILMKDMDEGLLNYGDEWIEWKGKRYPRKDGKIKYNGKWSEEGSMNFPWEKAAKKAETKK